MGYDFIDQDIVASVDLQPHDDDSFYNPVRNQHTGYAFDGSYYQVGVLQASAGKASWYSEPFGEFRGSTAAFPTYGLVLLSPAALSILDQSQPVLLASQLPLWMLFILADTYALANNFNGSTQGFLPSGLCYADGVISVTYSPDPGNQQTYSPSQHPVLSLQPSGYPTPYPVVSAQSSMVVSIDFVQDKVYLDVAV
jgi:hypothetical protein